MQRTVFVLLAIFVAMATEGFASSNISNRAFVLPNTTMVPAEELAKWVDAKIKLVDPVDDIRPLNLTSKTKNKDMVFVCAGKRITVSFWTVIILDHHRGFDDWTYVPSTMTIKDKRWVSIGLVIGPLGGKAVYDPMAQKVAVSIKGKTREFPVKPLNSSVGFCRPTEVNSPKGAVAQGWSAYSPDGIKVARSMRKDDPSFTAIYDQRSGWIYCVVNNNNPLKGFYWLPDSTHCALMYHTKGGKGHIIIRNLAGKVISRTYIGSWYHSMTISADGKYFVFPDGYKIKIRLS